MKKRSLFIVLIAVVMGIWFAVFTQGCTKDDELPKIDPTPGSSSTELLSLNTSAAPVVDGNIDASWTNCQKLVTSVTVPNPGADYFKGYVGNTYDVTMRSMYDNNKIYFLAEWNDNTKSLNRDDWYFNATTKQWAQEKNKPLFDLSGNKIRDAFYEDKFAMLWNVNNSVQGWDNLGCYASCHTGLDPATHGGATARHYTNSATEFIDMWHWKSVRTGLPNNQFDDQLQNNAEFGKDGGRTSDPKTSGGYSDNVQNLPVTGGTAGQTMNVPKYVIPGRTNYYWILKTEQDAGIAKLVTAVDNNGILYYNGGSIDPNKDVEFQRKGATVGSKTIPSVCDIAPFVGDRGDISAMAVYTGSGWVLEFSRYLVTSSGTSGNSDVQFDINRNYVFGIGVFENSAIAHAIDSKLKLIFKK